MILVLSELSLDQVRGIYTVRGQKNRMPDRARFLHPDAAASYLKLPLKLQVSDMLRSATSSMEAVESGRGAQPAGHSGHNFGLSIDVDLDYVLGENRMSKKAFDAAMAMYGWHCHRKDDKLESEAWHYNFFGVDPKCLQACQAFRTTASGIEYRIMQLYGSQMTLDARGIQTALSKLKLYDGAIDGDIGPQSRAGINAFQRMMMMPAGPATVETQRRLAFCTVSRLLRPPTSLG